MVRVKICGITNERNALAAVKYGAWALGFIFYAKSPRYVTPAKAKAIIQCLPPFVTAVGVFVNEQLNVVKRIAEFCWLNALQFHGDETPAYCRKFKGYKTIKVFCIKDKLDSKNILRYKTDAYLLDTFHEKLYGGSGKTFDWSLLKSLRKLKVPIILSGGLNPSNVAGAVKTFRPFAVDVSSGVEQSPGQKSQKLLREFFEKINDTAPKKT